MFGEASAIFHRVPGLLYRPAGQGEDKYGGDVEYDVAAENQRAHPKERTSRSVRNEYPDPLDDDRCFGKQHGKCVKE